MSDCPSPLPIENCVTSDQESSHLVISKKKKLYVLESSKNICNPQVVRLVLEDKEVDVYRTHYKKYVGEISWIV